MVDGQYILRYLPLFYEDLEQKIIYIAENLHNEKAANDLINTVEEAILERLPVAEAFEPYYSKKERRYKYFFWKNIRSWGLPKDTGSVKSRRRCFRLGE